MAIRYLDNINLEENQLLNASLQQVSSDPAGFEGQVIYNSTSGSLKFYSGATGSGAWVSLDGSGDITQVDITAGDGFSGTSVDTTSGAHVQTLTIGEGDGIQINATNVAVNSTVVRTSGTQTIGGAKTFTTIPVVGTASISDDSTKAASTAWVNDQGYVDSSGVTSITLAADTGTGTAITGIGTQTFVGAGLMSTAVTGTTVTISTTATNNLGDVLSVGAGDTTFIDGTSTGGTTPVISMALSATGTPSSSTYLRGDNSWATVPGGYTSWTARADAGPDNAIVDGDTVDFEGGTGLSSLIATVGTVSTVTMNLDNTAVTAGSYTLANITVDAQGRISAASNGAPGSSTFMRNWRITADTGTITSVTQNDLVDIQGGTGIATSASGLVIDVELDLDDLPPATTFDGTTEYLAMVTAGNTSSKIFGDNISVTELGAPTANFDIDTNKVINVVDPTNDQDAATKKYVDDNIVGGLIYQGGYNASTNTPNLDSNPNPNNIKQGWTYTVTQDGLFFTEQVRIGDVIIAEVDTPTALGDWTTVQNNIDIATTSVAGIASFPTAGGTSITAAGAVSLANVGSSGSVGSASQSLSITTDAKGRVTSRSAQSIAITSSQVTNFCTEVETCIGDATEYSTTIGNGTLTSIPVTHNLDTSLVIVQLFDTSSGETVNATVVRTSDDVVTISTSSAIATGAVTILIKAIKA
jgi:hypothetical protein